MAEPRTLYPGDGRFDSPGAHAPQLNTHARPWLNGRAPDPLSGRRAVRFPRGARTTTEHARAPLAQWQSPGPFIRETGGSIPPGRTVIVDSRFSRRAPVRYLAGRAEPGADLPGRAAHGLGDCGDSLVVE